MANLMEVNTFMQDKLKEHGLHNWYFTFDNAKRRFGCCDYRKRQVSLSMELCKLNDIEECKSTGLHEIAHALCPAGSGHGHIWRAKCAELGIGAERCYDGGRINMPLGRYKMVCSNCGATHYIHKRRKYRSACRDCCRKYNGGRFSDRFLFVVSDTTSEDYRMAKVAMDAKRS